METIKSILNKLNQITTLEAPITLIDKDLMLQLTRNLYEQIMDINIEKTEAAIQHIPEEVADMVAAPIAEEEMTSNNEVEHIEIEETEENVAFDEDADFIDDPSMEDFIEKIEPTALSENKPLVFEQTIIEPTNANQVQASIDIQELKEPKNVLAFKLWNKDVRSYIGINDKYNFISELFGNNAESYEEILNEINLCGSKSEVLQFLENSGITTLYKWDEEGFSVQAFYGVLSQFFSTK